MSRSENPHLSSRLELIYRGASVAVILAGYSALAGWMFDVAELKRVIPGLATMKTNMALAFALAGLSLCWSQTELPVQQRRFGAEDEQMILTKITPDLILIDIALPGMVIRPVLSSAHWSNGK